MTNTAFDKFVGITVGNYHLERFIGQSNLGPAFFARTDSATTCQLCFLAGPEPRDRQAYLERFQSQARQVAALQHPYILPLLDYGVYRGIPYLVTPHIPLRSLRARVDKNGPLDVSTIGRYLDQIATALEYAHEHGILHERLSVDNIFIKLDGNLVIGDFGTAQFLDPGQRTTSQDYLYGKGEAYAPEQLLGKRAGTYTDVYALGVVLYYLLTGSPVFSGGTTEEIAQEHLYGVIPPLNRSRGDLPPGLYSIIARALAKEPAQRFHKPGALANAYHRVVAPNNRTRVPIVVSTALPDQMIQPLNAEPLLASANQVEPSWSSNGSGIANRANSAHGLGTQNPAPQSLPGFSNEFPPLLPAESQPGPLQRFRNNNSFRIVLISLFVLLFVAASSTIGIVWLGARGSTAGNVSGQVIVFDSQNGPPGQNNSLNITVDNLSTPASGSQYDAWLINEQTEDVTILGALTEKNQTWSLSYNGINSSGQTNGNLLSGEDKLEITLEQGAVKLPVGKEILVGTYPPLSFTHILHLLVSFPATPGKIGLLVGVLNQTRLLSVQANVLQSLSASRNPVAIGCTAQSIIDIIEGKQGKQYQPLDSGCASQNVTATGDGYGLAGSGYLDGAVEHATLAISQPDATNVMRVHARLMATALNGIKGWANTILQDALQIRANPSDLASVPEIEQLANDAYYGTGVTAAQQTGPAIADGGAIAAYAQGQLMATLSLNPGA